jgi:hypothetical protein
MVHELGGEAVDGGEAPSDPGEGRDGAGGIEET